MKDMLSGSIESVLLNVNILSIFIIYKRIFPLKNLTLILKIYS